MVSFFFEADLSNKKKAALGLQEVYMLILPLPVWGKVLGGSNLSHL